MQSRSIFRKGNMPLPALVLVLLLALSAPLRALAGGAAEVRIFSAPGVRTFVVETATNDEERRRGLQHVRELPEGHGMLFLYGESDVRRMWMKDTLIPLDMLFINHGAVVRVHKQAVPGSEEVIDSGEPADGVLEIPGGSADALGLAPGDKVEYKFRKKR
jgi:uncharacterized membrane protein (UPF0127 family)